MIVQRPLSSFSKSGTTAFLGILLLLCLAACAPPSTEAGSEPISVVRQNLLEGMTIDPGIGDSSRFTGVSDRRIAAGVYYDGVHSHAITWQDGRTRDIHPAGAESSQPWAGPTHSGWIGGQIWRQDTEKVARPALWFPDGSVKIFDDVPGALGHYGAVTHVNDAGQAIVQDAFGGTAEVLKYLWSEAGGYRALGSLGADEWRTEVFDMNESGQVAGYARTVSGAAHAYRWQDGVMTDLGAPAEGRSWGMAINEAGDVAGMTGGPGEPDQAFLWRDGVMTIIDPSPSNSYVRDVNERGDVVGYRRGEPQRAVLWRDGRAIDPLAPNALSAEFIDDNGVVVGLMDKDGVTTGFMWRSQSEGLVELEPLPGDSYTTPTGIDSKTQTIVGTSHGPGSRRAVMWSYLHAKTPDELFDELIDAIAQATAAGELDRASRLDTLADGARAAHDSGDDCKAARVLQNFVRTAKRLIGKGRLDPDLGAELIDLAYAILRALDLEEGCSVTTCDSVKIDATAVSAPKLKGMGLRPFETSSVQTANPAPGDYYLRYNVGNIYGNVDLTVSELGTIEYDSALEGVLRGAGTCELTVVGANIDFDASALTAPELMLSAVTQDLPTHDGVQSLSLLPGAHHLRYITGPGSKHAQVDFSVTASGTVEYDAALEGVLQGAGTSTLTVRGVDFELDATPLSVQSLNLQSVDAKLQTDVVQTLTVLPGSHRLRCKSADQEASAVFTVSAEGIVGYEPELENVLSGAGSHRLTVDGATFQLDASALTVLSVDLKAVASLDPSAGLHTLSVLPGTQTLHYIGGNGGAGFAEVLFDVSSNGIVDYDASFASVLSGQGTNTLVVEGATIHLDATPLSVGRLKLRNINPSLDTQAGVHTLVLLPGIHRIAYGSPPNAAYVDYYVKVDGTVNYDASLNQVLSGAGTDTLTLSGAVIEFDATALSVPKLDLRRINSKLDTSTVHTLRLLPGQHRMRYDTGANYAGAEFVVNTDETVDYFMPSLFSGAGTSSLTVLGTSINVNVAPGVGDYKLIGVGNYAPGFTSFVLLPGTHEFQSAPNVFEFDIDEFDTVSVAPRAGVSGDGTSTLVVGAP